MNELQQDATIVLEHVEDVVEYICDTHFLSGEKVWVMIRSLSDYHLDRFPTDD